MLSWALITETCICSKINKSFNSLIQKKSPQNNPGLTCMRYFWLSTQSLKLYSISAREHSDLILFQSPCIHLSVFTRLCSSNCCCSVSCFAFIVLFTVITSQVPSELTPEPRLPINEILRPNWGTSIESWRQRVMDRDQGKSSRSKSSKKMN